MALSQQHRSSLFTSLTPLVGQEEAEALLREFPANDLETPATKDFVRAEGAILRAEMATEFGAVRAEMATEFGAVRAEIAGLRAEVADRFRAQTVWAIGLAVSLAGLVLACTAYLGSHLG